MKRLLFALLLLVGAVVVPNKSQAQDTITISDAYVQHQTYYIWSYDVVGWEATVGITQPVYVTWDIKGDDGTWTPIAARVFVPNSGDYDEWRATTTSWSGSGWLTHRDNYDIRVMMYDYDDSTPGALLDSDTQTVDHTDAPPE